MATSTKPPTPPLVSFTSYTNFLDQLREAGPIPSRIDRSLLPKASGSQVAGTLAALKYLGQIDENNKPSEDFKALVAAKDEERKPMFAKLLRARYAFIFADAHFDIEAATAGELAEKFRALEINGSTVTKTIAFFLALAKEAGVKVSPHIKPPRAPRGSGGTRRSSRRPDATNGRGEDSGSMEPPPPGTEQFQIPIPGKASVRVIVPSDLDAADWEMLQSMIVAYINRWKGFSPPKNAIPPKEGVS